MASNILHKRNALTGVAPTTGQLSLGEIAVNTFDGKLYIKKDNGVESIVEIGAGGGGGSQTPWTSDIVTAGYSLITSPVTTGTDANNIVLQGGNNSYAGGGYYSGFVNLYGGTGTSGNAGGYVNLYGGSSDSGYGGYVNITAGNSTSGYAGSIALNAGASSSNEAGSIFIQAGGSQTNASGYVIIRGGTNGSSGDGGRVQIVGGSGGTTGDGADVVILPGGTTAGTSGSINLHSGSGDIGQAAVRLWNNTNTAHTTGNYIELKAPAMVANRTITLPVDAPADGDVLTTTSAGVTSWEAPSGIASVSEDLTPQLGGNLDVEAHSITTSTRNGSITLTPDGTGNVVLGTMPFDADQAIGAGQDNFVLTYDHASGHISLEAGGGSLTPWTSNIDAAGFSLITQPTTTVTSAKNITIEPGNASNASGTSNGGNLTLNGSYGTELGGNPGFVNIWGGVSYGADIAHGAFGNTGGTVNIAGGDHYGNGTNVNQRGGDVNIAGGQSYGTLSGARSGHVNIYGGYAGDDGLTAGDVIITGGEAYSSSTSATAGNVIISGGYGYYGRDDGGDVTISGGYGSNGGQLILHGGYGYNVDGAVQVHSPENNAGHASIQLWRHTSTDHTVGNYIELKAPTMTVNRTITLPVDAPADGDVLTTTSGGITSWEAPSGGGLANVVEDTTPQLGGDLDCNTNVVGLSDGTNTAPSLTFGSDSTAGMFRPAANTIGFATGSTSRFTIGTYGVATVGSGYGRFGGGVDKLTTTSGVVSVSGATAPTAGQVLKATSSTVATWQDEAGGVANPLTADLDTGGYAIVTAAASGANADNISITGGAASGTYTGGTINITGGAGSASVYGAGITITGGAGGTSTGGGDVTITGGAHGTTGYGGNVFIQGGADANGSGTVEIGNHNDTAKLKFANDANITVTGTVNANSNHIDNAKTVTFIAEVANTTTTQTVDWTAGQKQKTTITAATGMTFTAPAGPSNLTLKVINGGTGVITWPATVKWPGGIEPGWTTTGTDICSFYYDGTNYYGMAGLAFA